jgi:hypothetical protein
LNYSYFVLHFVELFFPCIRGYGKFNASLIILFRSVTPGLHKDFSHLAKPLEARKKNFLCASNVSVYCRKEFIDVVNELEERRKEFTDAVSMLEERRKEFIDAVNLLEERRKKFIDAVNLLEGRRKEFTRTIDALVVRIFKLAQPNIYILIRYILFISTP